jgi:hypothetical protein
MTGVEYLNWLLSFCRLDFTAKPRRKNELDCTVGPALDSTSYEFMLESLLEVSSDRFDRWRNRDFRSH